jgi:prepilin-type processing-associated H-X9-DG protein
LLPAVQRVRAGARATESKNNLSQIGKAMRHYEGQGRGNLRHAGWQETLLPYVDAEKDAFVDPADTNGGSSYALTNKVLTMGRNDHAKIAVIESDDEAIVIDNTNCTGGMATIAGTPAVRHMGTTNALLYDGSVRAFELSEIDLADTSKKPLVIWWLPDREHGMVCGSVVVVDAPPPSPTATPVPPTPTPPTPTPEPTPAPEPTVETPPDCGDPTKPIVQGLTAEFATYHYTIGGPTGEWNKGGFFEGFYLSGDYEDHLTYFAKAVVGVNGSQFANNPSSWGLSQPSDWGGGHQFVRYCGQIKGPITGTVYFQGRWDDAMELVIDGQLVFFDTATSNSGSGWGASGGYDSSVQHIIEGNVAPGSFIHVPCRCPNQSFAPRSEDNPTFPYTTPYFKFEFVKDRWYDFQLMACNSNAGSWFAGLKWYSVDGQLAPTAPAWIPADHFRTTQP